MTKSAGWQRLTNAKIFFVLFFVGVQRYARGKERKKAITTGIFARRSLLLISLWHKINFVRFPFIAGRLVFVDTLTKWGTDRVRTPFCIVGIILKSISALTLAGNVDCALGNVGDVLKRHTGTQSNA